MKSTTRTQWFSNALHPVHEGVYEIKVLGEDAVVFSRWQNGLWFTVSTTLQKAQHQITKSYDMYQLNRPWRGFVEKQDD